MAFFISPRGRRGEAFEALGTDDSGRSGLDGAGARARRAPLWAHDESEHDACAVISNVKKYSRASHGNVKGFAFEYMTSGRGLLLGDPGPWLCSGMTGGVAYFLLDEGLGLTVDALRRRLAAGARVRLEAVGDADEANLGELLGHYRDALAEGSQHAEAEEVAGLAADRRRRFVKVVPAPAS